MALRTAETTKATFIQLNNVTGSDGTRQRTMYNDSDEDMGPAGPTAPTTPVIVAVDSIRCYNARKNNAPGTRLTFKDGGGFAVVQSVEAIRDAIGHSVTVVEVPAPAVTLATSDGEAVNTVN